MNTGRTRQPAGIPVGGQFATRTRSRSAVALDELSDERDEGQLLSDREAAELLDQARASGTYWGSRLSHNNDAAHTGEDAASIAMLAYLEARARADAADPLDAEDQLVVDASERPRPENVRAYVHTAVMRSTIISIGKRNGRARNYLDARAANEYHNRVNQKAVELRRAPTAAESAVIAEEIWDSFPANAKPHRNFYETSVHERRLLTMDHEAIVSMADHRAHESSTKDDEELETDTVPGSFRDRAEQIVASGGRGAQLTARSLAWSIMAEKKGAPHPVVGSVSEYRASIVRKTVLGGGGAVEVARRVRFGTATSDETEALFQPFGTLGEDERNAVLDVITSHPGYGGDLWDSSVMAATKERKK